MRAAPSRGEGCMVHWGGDQWFTQWKLPINHPLQKKRPLPSEGRHDVQQLQVRSSVVYAGIPTPHPAKPLCRGSLGKASSTVTQQSGHLHLHLQ